MPSSRSPGRGSTPPTAPAPSSGSSSVRSAISWPSPCSTAATPTATPSWSTPTPTAASSCADRPPGAPPPSRSVRGRVVEVDDGEAAVGADDLVGAQGGEGGDHVGAQGRGGLVDDDEAHAEVVTQR